MRFPLPTLALLCLSALSACTSTPPVHWAEGGSPLVVARARWDRPDGPVDVLDDGRVLMAGATSWSVDRAGRVTDPGGEPVALLLPDGQLAGNDSRSLGYIGESNTSPPGDPHAWVVIEPTGRVLRYDPDGNATPAGVWTGCQGPQIRVCALVTHLVALREQAQRPQVSVGFGVGVGVIH